MKQLVENFKNFLSESPDSKIKYFGPNPEDLQCFAELRSIEAPNTVTRDSFSDCMQSEGWKLLGHGSFRTAFAIPDTKELILKTINPRLLRGGESVIQKAKNMNKMEAQSEFQTSTNLAVRVYDSAEDFMWIKSEFVIRIKNWSDMLSFFPVLSRNMPLSTFQKTFPKLLRRDPYKELAKNYRDPLLIELIDALRRAGAPTWDIRPGNVGYVTRGGKSQFVVLDPGFGLPSDDLYDAMRRGEAPIPQELRGQEHSLVDPFAATKTAVINTGPETKVARPRRPDDSTRAVR